MRTDTGDIVFSCLVPEIFALRFHYYRESGIVPSVQMRENVHFEPHSRIET